MEELASLYSAAGVFAASPYPAVLWSDGAVIDANASAQGWPGGVAALVGALERRLNALGSDAAIQELLLPMQAGSDQPPRTLRFLIARADGRFLAIASDATKERHILDALKESRGLYRDLLGLSCDFAWQTNASGQFVFLSPDIVFGFEVAGLLGRGAEELGLNAEDARLFGIEAPSLGLLVWLKDAQGRPVCVEICGRALFASDGSFAGARGICRDVTDREQNEARVAEARQRERSLVHLLRLAREGADPADRLARALKTVAQAIGAIGAQIWRPGNDGDWSRAFAFGQDIGLSNNLLPKDGQAQSSAAVFRGYLALSVPMRSGGRNNGLLSLWREEARGPWDEDDLALLTEAADLMSATIEQLSEQEALARLSETDALTGLLNRRGFESGFEQALEHARRLGQDGALIFIDFDNFKEINDRCGHAQGDAALRAAGELLRGHLRNVDLLGRLGGDEFAIWLGGVPAEEAARKGCEIASAGAALQRFAGDSPKRIGFSVGVAAVGAAALAKGISKAQAMEIADQAMYAVKRAGKGACSMVAA